MGPSYSRQGFEDDLNSMTKQGWRYVGPINRGDTAVLVFEKP